MRRKKVAPPPKQLKFLSEQVRECLKTCGQTRYAVSQATGIDQAVLSRFMWGETLLSGASLDVLGKYLRLEVVMHGLEESQKKEQQSDKGVSGRRRAGSGERE